MIINIHNDWRTTKCWAFTVRSPRCRTSVSAMTAVGWWSALFEALRTFFPSTLTAERRAPEPTCLHAWSIAWAGSRRAPGWRRSSRSWAANRAAGVAPFLDFLVARLDHHYMVSKRVYFWEIKLVCMFCDRSSFKNRSRSYIRCRTFLYNIRPSLGSPEINCGKPPNKSLEKMEVFLCVQILSKGWPL